MKTPSLLTAVALAAALAGPAWAADAAAPAAQASVPAQVQSDPGDWIVYDDLTYTPVLDDVSRALQQARQALDKHQPKEAAQAMRRASQALAQEATKVAQLDQQRAADAQQQAAQTHQRMQALTARLDATAQRLEAGQIGDTKALDQQLDKAARADLEQRWRVSDTTTWVPVADAPQRHMLAAMQDYLRKNYHAAATEVRKADGYLRLEAARASGTARGALDEAHEALVTSAQALDSGAQVSEQALRNSFARADHALALARREQAASDLAHQATASAGQALGAASQDLAAAAHWLGGESERGASATVAAVRTLGDKLAAGGHWAHDEAAAGFERLGNALDDVGRHLGLHTRAQAVRLPPGQGKT
ncbi:MAG: hypothetical protein JSR53_02705 [Proteobacteria bacterium]|nr:hypothetical protein [Pseudomonadota bacterium]